MRKRPTQRAWAYIAGLAAVVVLFVWTLTSIQSLGDELEQSRSDNAALAKQVRSLGGQPVAEGKPGQRGDQGPMGPQGIQGPVGPQGPPGPIGITGQSPRCLLEPTRCVGPAGATGAEGGKGATGDTGSQGPQGDTGATGQTGPQGPQGEVGPQGPVGVDGKDGKDGRGVKSITCQDDGDWLITYTDDTTSTTDGPCRAVPPIGTGN